MSSNLACVGLAVDDSRDLGFLVDRAMAAAYVVGTFDGVEVRRWQGQSGAALVLGWQGRDVVDLLPTFAATVGGAVADCRLINESVASAALVDSNGEQLTAMAFEAEQYRQMRSMNAPVAGAVRITALGVSVQIHADATAFALSPDSLLDRSADPAEEAPAHYIERGFSWPPRVASESFISHGIFGDPTQSTAHARLSGLVLSARHRVCELTGQGFSVARVRTVGFEADLCLSDSEHPTVPQPDNIVSGTVFLAAAVDAAELADTRQHKRSVFSRRRSSD
ncbi:MAG: hypothetical protein DLM57_11430 [Pseudonocardiales bacterium]|nr:MAG: hypothetical protein DLM57_11430 [Pseudonocardiales bacterium]